MLIKFSVSNFLSINEKQEFSMLANKTRKNSERIYKSKNIKLTKCKSVFGANASGKSNLVEAFQFMQDMIEDGLPRGFSTKYFRLSKENHYLPSIFEIELLLNDRKYIYGFSIKLNEGTIQNEWLYEISTTGINKLIFQRNILKKEFITGEYFKDKEAISKIETYGKDSLDDSEILFLNIINTNKSKMFTENIELKIFRDIFTWFVFKLTISNPSTILTGYPYFSDSNLNEIAELLNALGTGISDLKFIDVPKEIVKNKIPEKLYIKITADLEKQNVKAKKSKEYRSPSGMIRGPKEFYTFEINQNDTINIKTIEFSHENSSIFFNLKEESDGTARLLDLIEILFKVSDNHTFVIDEIDRCLHPIMTEKIIELFLKMAEYRNTQLIITSHESRLLTDDLLRNDEINFILKTPNGSSIINPLEKYQLRTDKKVYAALFDGTLDAIPKFNTSKLESLIQKSSR